MVFWSEWGIFLDFEAAVSGEPHISPVVAQSQRGMIVVSLILFSAFPDAVSGGGALLV